MSALVFSTWSAVSPFGVGADPFREGIRSGRSAVAALDPDAYPGPFGKGALIPDFTAAAHLGKKGTRTMDRVTAIAVTAVGQLLADAGLLAEGGAGLTDRPEETGLVLGTGSGSVQSIMDFTRDSLTAERPYHVDPARFPNTVMNRAAGQSAIWHRIKGPNTTIAGGRLTGLTALSYAARLHRGGHCARILCGAAEEYSVQRAWLEWHGRDGDDRETPLGEGGAVFLLETAEDARRAGRRVRARLLTTRFRAFGAPAEAREALAECVRDALKQVGGRAEDIGLVAPVETGGVLAGVEELAVEDVLGRVRPRWLGSRALLGDTSAAASSLQLAALLTAIEDEEATPGALSLATAVDRDGTVGCALLAAPADEES
ncbi:beta-ketoacyl synthase N-terminal-like domain-containing protein [Streptomyces sp. NPDC088131]|uniref:beta-ketoacyl synthase N-terminal-like domain-containing protein n=1 Tax=Streptomyces sp. NPDC088131 TaxID=3365826 RepID=UPI0037FC3D9F